MGLFGKIFGSTKEGNGRVRCNECGMADGRHTDWCPLFGEDEAPSPGDVSGARDEDTAEAPRTPS